MTDFCMVGNHDLCKGTSYITKQPCQCSCHPVIKNYPINCPCGGMVTESGCCTRTQMFYGNCISSQQLNDAQLKTKNDNQLLRSCYNTFSQCYTILEKKNKDYAGMDNPYANFELCKVFDVPVTRGILIRIGDKIKRISNLLNKEASVTEETLDDTIQDAINYLAILKAYREMEKELKDK